MGKNVQKKSVNVGADGLTPVKIIEQSLFPARRVNVGLAGLTPKKVVAADGSTQVFNIDKHVNVGQEGSTPKKFFHFDKSFPPSRSILPDKISTTNSTTAKLKKPLQSPAAPQKFSPSRPTTSRGKSHPSPDEFYDYVIPSPEPSCRGTERVVLRRTSSSESTNSENKGEDDNESDSDMIYMDFELENSPVENVNVISARPTSAPSGDHHSFANSSYKQKQVANLRVGGGEGINESKPTSIDDTLENDRRSVAEDNTNLSNEEVEALERKIRVLGCWLFGSALRI